MSLEPDQPVEFFGECDCCHQQGTVLTINFRIEQVAIHICYWCLANVCETLAEAKARDQKRQRRLNQVASGLSYVRWKWSMNIYAYDNHQQKEH
jgi:hypothetical protein